MRKSENWFKLQKNKDDKHFAATFEAIVAIVKIIGHPSDLPHPVVPIT